jgi:Luciferase-like monooxygenase
VLRGQSRLACAQWMPGVTRRRGDMLAEYLDILRRGFADEEFSYDGRSYKVRNVHIVPKAVQALHLPLFVVAMPDAPSTERVVRKSFNTVYAREARFLFVHAAAQTHFGGSVFWLRRLAVFDDEHITISHWQIKRDGSSRGIVEIIPESL